MSISSRGDCSSEGPGRRQISSSIGGDGGPVRGDSISHTFAEIADAAGLGDVRLHDLRHGFATTLLAAGVNVKVVSEALGHASTAFTMDVYAHVLPTMGAQVASAIEAALGGGERR